LAAHRDVVGGIDGDAVVENRRAQQREMDQEDRARGDQRRVSILPAARGFAA